MTNNRLEEIFESMVSSTYMGVPGFMRIDSGKPGPVLGITACTHGNEPSGLFAIEYLLNDLKIATNLQNGSVILGVNNIEAVRSYLSGNKTARFLDLNMNRLDFKNYGDEKYEIRRAKECMPVWRSFEVGFDIHSTLQDSDPMIITGWGQTHKKLWQGFPIKIVLDKIDMVQIGKPAYAFYGSEINKIPVFEIEAGSHENEKSFERAKICVESLLINLGMIQGETVDLGEQYEMYELIGSVIFPDKSYTLSRFFPDFGVVTKGTLLASSSDEGKLPIYASQDCAIIFGPKADNLKGHKPLGEEVLFLTKPPVKY